MNIADILAPKPPPTIDAARVTTHTLDDDETKESDMSLVTEITTAVAQLGGRCNNADLKLATGFDEKKLGNAIYLAKKAGQIDRDGKDYVLANSAAATISNKPAKGAAKPAKGKPAKPTKKPPAPPKSPGRPRHATPEPIPSTGALIAISDTGNVEAYVLASGGAIVTQCDVVLHRLSPAAVAAILNATLNATRS